jgi:hypothetical protein
VLLETTPVGPDWLVTGVVIGVDSEERYALVKAFTKSSGHVV